MPGDNQYVPRPKAHIASPHMGTLGGSARRRPFVAQTETAIGRRLYSLMLRTAGNMPALPRHHDIMNRPHNTRSARRNNVRKLGARLYNYTTFEVDIRPNLTSRTQHNSLLYQHWSMYRYIRRNLYRWIDLNRRCLSVKELLIQRQ
jgi:hypothetical protein